MFSDGPSRGSYWKEKNHGDWKKGNWKTKAEIPSKSAKLSFLVVFKSLFYEFFSVRQQDLKLRSVYVRRNKLQVSDLYTYLELTRKG